MRTAKGGQEGGGEGEAERKVTRQGVEVGTARKGPGVEVAGCQAAPRPAGMCLVRVGAPGPAGKHY